MFTADLGPRIPACPADCGDWASWPWSPAACSAVFLAAVCTSLSMRVIFILRSIFYYQLHVSVAFCFGRVRKRPCIFKINLLNRFNIFNSDHSRKLSSESLVQAQTCLYFFCDEITPLSLQLHTHKSMFSGIRRCVQFWKCGLLLLVQYPSGNVQKLGRDVARSLRFLSLGASRTLSKDWLGRVVNCVPRPFDFITAVSLGRHVPGGRAVAC